MTEENQAIPKEVVEEVEKEISAQEQAEIQKVKNEYTQKLSELEKKIIELTKDKADAEKEEKPKDVTEELKKQLEESRKEMEKMKADFEKQLESIKLRKSIPSDVVKEEKKIEKPYMKLSEAEKDEIDRQFFRSIGVNI